MSEEIVEKTEREETPEDLKHVYNKKPESTKRKFKIGDWVRVKAPESDYHTYGGPWAAWKLGYVGQIGPIRAATWRESGKIYSSDYTYEQTWTYSLDGLHFEVDETCLEPAEEPAKKFKLGDQVRILANSYSAFDVKAGRGVSKIMKVQWRGRGWTYDTENPKNRYRYAYAEKELVPYKEYHLYLNTPPRAGYKTMKETITALAAGEQIIKTTQLALTSAMLFKMGYIIYLHGLLQTSEKLVLPEVTGYKVDESHAKDEGIKSDWRGYYKILKADDNITSMILSGAFGDIIIE